MNIGIVGWHDGLAGQIDSWYENSEEIKVRLFISPDKTPLDAKHIKRATKNFSYPQLGRLKDKDLIIDPEWYLNMRTLEIDAVIIAISDPILRLEQIRLARENSIKIVNAIHPTCIIGQDCSIGTGVILCSGVIVGYKCEIQEGVLVNTGAQIDHHGVIERGVTIDPGCLLAGNVQVQELAQIHTGATIINRISIGKGTVIGAGALILKNAEPHSVYYGVPAKRIRAND